MEHSIHWVSNMMPTTKDDSFNSFALSEIQKVHTFHQSFPQYKITPLIPLTHMAHHLGLNKLYIKDESHRFGLNSFKVLGASYAMGKYIAKMVDKDISELPYSVLISDDLRKAIGDLTFVTATVGNHGYGVAFTANQIKQKSSIYMPKGTAKNRQNHILKESAQVSIEEGNYNDCIRLASTAAIQISNSVLIQDTAWNGYTEIPTWIMQGYGTMSMEAIKQLKTYNCECPTHIFIQAGAGSLAGSVAAYFKNYYRDLCPTIIVVESDAAACLFKSTFIGDGLMHCISGDLTTIMTHLACGEGNPIAYNILKNSASSFVSCHDKISARGMRLLAAPLPGDPSIVSGESGAITMGLLYSLMLDPTYHDFRESIQLNKDSRVLLFSTEGDTDPARYHSIVWDGMNSIHKTRSMSSHADGGIYHEFHKH